MPITVGRSVDTHTPSKSVAESIVEETMCARDSIWATFRQKSGRVAPAAFYSTRISLRLTARAAAGEPKRAKSLPSALPRLPRSCLRAELRTFVGGDLGLGQLLSGRHAGGRVKLRLQQRTVLCGALDFFLGKRRRGDSKRGARDQNMTKFRYQFSHSFLAVSGRYMRHHWSVTSQWCRLSRRTVFSSDASLEFV